MRRTGKKKIIVSRHEISWGYEVRLFTAIKYKRSIVKMMRELPENMFE